MSIAESGLDNMSIFNVCFVLNSLQCSFFDLSVLLGLLCFYCCLNSRALLATLELWLAWFFSDFLLLENLVYLASLPNLISNKRRSEVQDEMLS